MRRSPRPGSAAPPHKHNPDFYSDRSNSSVSANSRDSGSLREAAGRDAGSIRGSESILYTEAAGGHRWAGSRLMSLALPRRGCSWEMGDSGRELTRGGSQWRPRTGPGSASCSSDSRSSRSSHRAPQPSPSTRGPFPGPPHPAANQEPDKYDTPDPYPAPPRRLPRL
uniref:Uncharacterized protein n=1 Tax=Vombatus ursinus TaxID=29139 RepID=A0A4X2LUN9_VOMUR